jgi:hypothetical protein
MSRFRSVFLLAALGAVPLAAADRISFEDGTVLTVNIVEQTDETFTYLDEKGASNTVYKSELKGVEFKIGEDKFLQAALEETDSARQILLLEKSVNRFPKDRVNHNMLARCYLREMQLPKANGLLTNRALDNPGFDLARVMYHLKTTNSDLALKTLGRLSRRRWDDTQRMQAAILESFAMAELGRVDEAITFLGATEGRWGLALWVSYSNLMAYLDYPHYRKTLHSLAYLAKTPEYRAIAAREKLRPNLTRYWRRVSDWPAGTPLVESMVIRERPATENLRTVLAIVGVGMLGAGAAFTAEWADQYQDYLTARAWYENATREWELKSSSSSFNSKDANNDNVQLMMRLSFQVPVSAYDYYSAWSSYMTRFAYSIPNLLTFGALLEYLALADPGRRMEKARRTRPPMHIRFETDAKPPNALKLGCGLSSVALLSASAVFTVDAIRLWQPITYERYTAYTNNTRPDYMDLYYLGAQRAQQRTEAYRALAITTAAAAVLTGVLYFIDPWKKVPTTGMILPMVRPDGLAIQWMGLL